MLRTDGDEEAVSRWNACAATADKDAEIAATNEAIKTDARSTWAGLFMDGRNEHGTHVLALPQSTLGQPLLEEDLEPDAERIFQEAEAIGFKTGHAIVCIFRFVREEYNHGYYEFDRVSAALTNLMFGTPEEQDAEVEKYNQECEPALAGRDASGEVA